ncbi:MAG: TlpA disulfide reductase family protein [Phycisphaerae bacterium]|nr:TlpA disulfide reductase family protein [Phycisphaerae bacterium]
MNKSKSAAITELVLVFCLSACIALVGCKKSSPAKAPADKQSSPSPADKTAAPATAKNPAVSKAIDEIMARRNSWNPILMNYYGKEMPDFKVEDINGKAHRLKDYRGKNVMVIMWATWCQPCLQEIPHLIVLREIMPADKLAILAISNEAVSTIKATAQSRNINYTVISNQSTLPEPFSSIRGYPTAFFIRPDGTLKLVVEGGSQLGEMKAIILAE